MSLQTGFLRLPYRGGSDVATEGVGGPHVRARAPHVCGRAGARERARSPGERARSPGERARSPGASGILFSENCKERLFTVAGPLGTEAMGPGNSARP